MLMSNIFHRRTQRLAMLTLVTFLSVCASVATAQDWLKPVYEPPINNPGQPPSYDELTGYVRRNTTTAQMVTSPLGIGTGTSFPSYLSDISVTNPAALQAQDTASAIDVYSDAVTGVYGYGSVYGVYGYSGGSGSTAHGVYGSTDLGYAARFHGPVQVSTNAANGASGILSVAGSIQTDEGVVCKQSSGCTVTNDYWLQAGQSADGAAVYAQSLGAVGIPAIDISTNDSVSENGYAAQGYSTLGFGLVGYGTTGIHGLASGTDSKTYIGIAGYGYGLASSKGIFGESTGGLGTASPSYDIAAGIRACVRDGNGAIVNRYGVYGTGGQYAGYFEGTGLDTGDGGDILIANGVLKFKGTYICSNNATKTCTVDSDCSSSAQHYCDVDRYLTLANLKGLLCRASGVTNAANCPQ